MATPRQVLAMSCLLSCVDVDRAQLMHASQFGVMRDWFYSSTEEVHLVRTHMECAALCQRDDCCLSAVSAQRGLTIECQMLRHLVSDRLLEALPGAMYFYVQDPNGQLM